MPGKLSLGLTGAAVGAALLGVWLIPGPPPGARAPAAAASSAPAALPEDERLFRPEAGFRYAYGFKRTIEFDGDLGGARMPPVAFSGELFVDVLRADAHAFEAVVSERITGAPEPRAPFARIEADARGDDLSFFRADDLTDEERQHVSVVKDLVALWMFPMRADTVGEFDARFEPMPAEAGFSRERKVKVAYRSHAPNTPAILSSEHFLLWDNALHLPKEVSGAEKTQLGRGKTALVADSRYRLLFRARLKAPEFDSGLLAGLGAKKETLALDTTRAASMADHPDYKNLNWNKILADLRDIDQLAGMKQLGVFGDALKYLRLHPDQVSDLTALLLNPSLLTAGADSAEFRTLVGALATSGGATALAALREAYQDPSLPAAGKQTILAALTTTPASLDPPTISFLDQAMQSETNPSLAQSAAYAAAAAIQNSPHDPQVPSILSQFASNFTTATTAAQQMTALDEMGNTGRAEFLPQIESVLNNGNEPADVQAKAEFALRYINSPVASQYLIKGLASPDVSVRAAAANAIGIAGWSESYRAPLASCSAAETVSQIQTACRATLSLHSQMASSN